MTHNMGEKTVDPEHAITVFLAFSLLPCPEGPCPAQLGPDRGSLFFFVFPSPSLRFRFAFASFSFRFRFAFALEKTGDPQHVGENG